MPLPIFSIASSLIVIYLSFLLDPKKLTVWQFHIRLILIAGIALIPLGIEGFLVNNLGFESLIEPDWATKIPTITLMAIYAFKSEALYKYHGMIAQALTLLVMFGLLGGYLYFAATNPNVVAGGEAKNFYEDYKDCRLGILENDPKYKDYNNSNPVSYCVNKNEFTTEDFKRITAGNSPGEYDPITCSQNLPDRSSFRTTDIKNDVAFTKVIDFYGDSPKNKIINLKTEDGNWKVFSVSCIPAIANEYFELKELGIKIKVADELKDLVYSIENFADGGHGISFSTQSLIEKDPNTFCGSAEAGPIGTYTKVYKSQLTNDPYQPDIEAMTKDRIDKASGTVTKATAKEYPDFYILFRNIQDTCSEDPEFLALQSKQSKALRNTVPTVELLK